MNHLNPCTSWPLEPKGGGHGWPTFSPFQAIWNNFDFFYLDQTTIPAGRGIGEIDNKTNSVQFNWSWDWAWQYIHTPLNLYGKRWILKPSWTFLHLFSFSGTFLIIDAHFWTLWTYLNLFYHGWTVFSEIFLSFLTFWNLLNLLNLFEIS